MAKSSPPATGRLPVRWAVILLAAVVLGLLSGVLTYAGTQCWPTALLAGFASAGMAISTLHRVIDR